MAQALLAGSGAVVETHFDGLMLSLRTGLLTASQIAQLLSGATSLSPHGHVLMRALKSNNADAIAAFGDLVARGHDKGIFNMRDIQALLAPNTNPPLEQLLAKSDSKTAAAYQKIMRDRDYGLYPPVLAAA